MKKDGYNAHETLIVKDGSRNKDLLLGSAQRTIVPFFHFVHVTYKVVEKYCCSKNALTKMFQFSEAISDEWSTLAQRALFAQHIAHYEDSSSEIFLVR